MQKCCSLQPTGQNQCQFPVKCVASRRSAHGQTTRCRDSCRRAYATVRAYVVTMTPEVAVASVIRNGPISMRRLSWLDQRVLRVQSGPAEPSSASRIMNRWLVPAQAGHPSSLAFARIFSFCGRKVMLGRRLNDGSVVLLAFQTSPSGFAFHCLHSRRMKFKRNRWNTPYAVHLFAGLTISALEAHPRQMPKPFEQNESE
jgi:hypothetical protein